MGREGSLEKKTFEAWYDLADSSVSMTYSGEVTRLRAVGGWLKDPIFLHHIRADALEDAIELHEKKMDWENFWAQKDLIADCSDCGVRYFLRRSASCPHCESIA
jgi:hypothetical protein